VNGDRNAKVVITGMGAITPLGNDVETFWSNLCAGQSGVTPITRFDATAYATRIAAEVKDFDPTLWMERKEAKRNDRDYCHVAAWEYKGDGVKPERHVEPLTYEFVHLAERSYK